MCKMFVSNSQASEYQEVLTAVTLCLNTIYSQCIHTQTHTFAPDNVKAITDNHSWLHYHKVNSKSNPKTNSSAFTAYKGLSEDEDWLIYLSQVLGSTVKTGFHNKCHIKAHMLYTIAWKTHSLEMANPRRLSCLRPLPVSVSHMWFSFLLCFPTYFPLAVLFS